MNRTFNRVTIIGNVGKPPRVVPSKNKGGPGSIFFRVATERGYQDKKGEWVTETQWISVKFFRGEPLAKYLVTGKQVFIEGRLELAKYDADVICPCCDKPILVPSVSASLIAEEVILLGVPEEQVVMREFPKPKAS